MEEQQNEKMSPKARWIIGGIVTICLAVLIVVAIQLNKKQEPEVATEATQDKKEKTADEQIGSDLEKALSELKKDKSSEDKKTASKDKTTATKSSDPFAYLFNPSKSDDPLTFLSIDPTDLPDVPEPVVSKTEDVAGVQDDKTPNGPVAVLPTDLNQTPLPDVDDPKLSGGRLDLGEDKDDDDTVSSGSPLDGINGDPTTPDDKPTDPDDKPTDPDDKPTDPDDKPTDPDDKPTDPDDKPTDPDDKPTDPDDKPTDPDDKPTDPDDKPTDPDDKPTDPDDKPTDPDDKPTDPDDKPTDPDDKPTDPDDKPLENVSIALQEETYDRLISYKEQQQIYNALYYGNKENLKDQKIVTLLDEMLKNYNNASDTDITARQLIQSLNQSQLNDEQARVYNAQLAKLKEEIEKVTREEYVDVYVINEGSSKDQLYYAGTFKDLLNGNKDELEKAKNSEMALADQKANEAAENLKNNKLDELQRKANQKALIEAINSYQLIANYSTEADNEAEAKRNEALRILSESVEVSDEPEIENNDTTKVETDDDNKTEPKVDDQKELKKSLDQLMEDGEYIQVLQQASAYVEQYPELEDTIKEASEKLLEQSIKDMKSNNAYKYEDTKKYLSQSYAALTGLSTVPSEVSEKAQDEFYGYRLVMQAEKLIDEDPTQAVIFAHEGYKRQETNGAKDVLQKANTALSEKAVGMEQEQAERAYEILTVTAQDVNEDIAQTAVDRKTAYGYAATGKDLHEKGNNQEAIVYFSEANRLYPEKDLTSTIMKETAQALLDEVGTEDVTEQIKIYNLLVNVKGLDESIKTQAESRKTVIDILDRVNTLEKQEQNVEERTQQVFYYLDEAVGAAENSGWSDEEKAKVQQRYDAHISSMLEQAQTWSTGSEEERKNAAVYYKVIAEKGTHVGEETVANAKEALTELGYK
ncbi:hypothetical protein [Priestia filamentosa]|uniref:hypothetical protein n=1 Tax=Priestia filamentosa TaxID=1402861 RepID=UPI000A08B306|nr:hypothetical protein [Priestia filamentosa]SMF12803.1 hypothetical protein SAMN06296056_1011072 [Priestia filamentosa]